MKTNKTSKKVENKTKDTSKVSVKTTDKEVTISPDNPFKQDLFIMDSFKEDVIEYLNSKGYEVMEDNLFPYSGNDMFCGYGDTYSLFKSPKGKSRNLERLWDKDMEFINKSCLEYIGSILIKHKVKKIHINSFKYSSTDWKFDNIRKV